MNIFITYHKSIEGGQKSIILLVASSKDVASLNIKKQILSHYPYEKTNETFQENPTYEAYVGSRRVKMVTLNKESIYAQDLADSFKKPELIVFISRHSSESETPTLSVHTPGNLNEAELGGIPRKISISPANAMRHALKVMMQLKSELQLDYEVCYEGTHHGPSLDVPTMFAELGSSLKQWSDLRAAEVVAHAAMKAISEMCSFPAKAVLGIGGPHYNAKFTRIALEDQVAFGHMIPKYAIPSIDKEILRQCVERTLEKVDHAILDWKGIKGESKLPVLGMLEEIGLPFEKV